LTDFTGPCEALPSYYLVESEAGAKLPVQHVVQGRGATKEIGLTLSLLKVFYFRGG